MNIEIKWEYVDKLDWHEHILQIDLTLITQNFKDTSCPTAGREILSQHALGLSMGCQNL